LTSRRARLRAAAAGILETALHAAEPGSLVRRHLKLGRRHLEAAGVRHALGRGTIALVAVGKAALPMAWAAEELLGDHLASALAVTTVPDGTPGSRPPVRGRSERLLVRGAGHPVPDARGLAAAGEVEALARGLGRDDLLLLLVSGGASALLPSPAEGVTLDDKARTTTLLLRAGASIGELNVVRKHLSRLKGGGLARAAAPAHVVALVLSDVVGDDLSTIGSGPTVPDPTTFAQALEVLERRGVLGEAPEGVRRRLADGARGSLEETPKPGDPIFRKVRTRVVGSGRLSVLAAAREAKRRGLRPLVLTSRLEGEAREVARVLVAILREQVDTAKPGAAPICLLAGGETTVTVQGQGQGGRNQELAVAAAQALSGFPVPAVCASLATDGIDGASDAAGGIVDDTTTARGTRLGLAPPAAFLAASDTRNYLGPLGDLILTGPTGTNVADIVTLLAIPGPRKGYNVRDLPGGAP
jgi:glycerate 2-kinase